MRYFFFLPYPKPALARRVFVAASTCQTIARARSAQTLLARKRGTLTGAVAVAPIAVTTDKDLATTAGAKIVTGTGEHRRKGR